MKRLRQISLAWWVLAAHLGALVFGLVGLLIMLPHPELWSSDPNAVRVFDWSMEHAGASHIVLGALTMVVFGWQAIGWRKTTIFALVSITCSLAFELFGTGTGWPFGNYEYTSFLGYKVLGRVPWTIPLSWFYMGLASYLIGAWIAGRLGIGKKPFWPVLLGVWMLTAWDLVLDPAMAHESLRVKFWIWNESGPYFGMPVKNFVGWTLTALVFMTVSRYLWGSDEVLNRAQMQLPVVVYLANMLFAMTISAAVGLWQPVVIATLIAGAPLAVSRLEARGVLRQPRLQSER